MASLSISNSSKSGRAHPAPLNPSAPLYTPLFFHHPPPPKPLFFHPSPSPSSYWSLYNASQLRFSYIYSFPPFTSIVGAQTQELKKCVESDTDYGLNVKFESTRTSRRMRVVVRRKWRPKKCGSVSAVPEEGSVLLGTTTTVMIKNVPNGIKRKELLKILDIHCSEQNQKLVCDETSAATWSMYDFVYLPMDFRRRANYGYAFVNFTSGEAARRFEREFNNYAWSEMYTTSKICAISLAKIQGKEALVDRFKHSVFRCRSDEYLPVVFSPPRDGCVPTPPSTLGIRKFDR